MTYTASLAQLVEQEPSKLWVAGSNPARGTILVVAMLVCGLAFTTPVEAAKHKAAKAASDHAVKINKAPSTKHSRAEAVTSKVKPSPSIDSRHASKKHGKLLASARSAVAEEPAPRAIILEKGAVPARTQLGCSTESAGLAAVGQMLKVAGKTFRCQKTWDYIEGKFIGYPAWVELFMPTPGWGAGLRETAPPPPDALAAAALPGAGSTVAPLANTQPEAEAEKSKHPPASVNNQLY